MKRFTLVLNLVFIVFATFAQTTPEQFLQSVPALPNEICSLKQAEKESCIQKFEAFGDKIEAEIDRRNKSADKNAEDNAEAMKKGALKQAGFDEATIAQMENATPEQRKALADKMMQQQYNISMDDAQNLKNMTKEQREAWAAAHGAKVAADAQANPDKYKTQNTNSTELYKVTTEIQELNKKFKSKETEFQQRINTIINDPDAEKRRVEIDGLQSKLTSMGGEVSDAEAKKMDEIAAQMKRLKSQYCAEFAPQYLVVVKDYMAKDMNHVVCLGYIPDCWLA